MYVYLLRSRAFPAQTYVGKTTNFRRRLIEHNSGSSTYTRAHAPWDPVTVIWFDDPEKATEFEVYLKHGSGFAFAKKHFW